MFTVTTPKPGLVTAEIGGHISRDEMSVGLDALTAAVNGMETANVLTLYHDFDMPEIAALMEEFKRLPQMFAMIAHLDRVAVVSDQKWVRDVAALEGMVLPGVTLRSFSHAERAAAEQFLDGDGDPEDSDGAELGDNVPV